MASDFHTHNPGIEIRGLVSSPVALPGHLTSWEIHPWHLPEKFADFHLPSEDELKLFNALGEIGLDKLRGADYGVQQQCFTELLKTAVEFHKPVVIHGVRAFQEIFAELKKFPELKVMWHGFCSSPQMLDELWRRNVTVSFHPRVVNYPDLLAKLIHAGGAYGFESDDNLNISLIQLIKEVEKITGIRDLEKITDQNFDDFLEI